MKQNIIETTLQRPADKELAKGEIAVHTVDGILFTSPDGTLVEDMGGAIIHQNINELTADYTLRAGMSGTVASGFKVGASATLTIPAGSVLSVV